MKNKWFTILSLLIALLFINVTAAMARNSAVFLDDDSATYLPNAAAWTESTFFPTTYGQGYHYARRNGSIHLAGPYLRMLTPSSLDTSGGGVAGTSGSQHQAHLRWSSAPGRCANVRAEVWNFTANTLVRVATFDQRIQTQAFNWNPLGSTFTAIPGARYEIRVYANNNIVSGGGVNCIASVDGGAFFQQTTNSSDTFNLTRNSIDDEAGIDYDTNSSTVTITSTSSTTPTILQGAISITCPNSGYIHAQGSGGYSILRASSTSTTSVSWVRYGVSLTTAYDFTSDTIHGEKNGISSSVNQVLGYQSVYVDRVDTCSRGQSFTYRFVAYRGNAGVSTALANPNLVVKYFPTRY